MLRRLCLVLALFAALSVLGRCARARIRPAGEILTVCLSTYDAHALPNQASVVRELRRQGTVLWLVLGDQFADQWLTAATDGAGPVRLLSAAGVDAVLLTPEWLSFGLLRQQELVNSAGFYVLGANLQDASGQSLGHPFLVKHVGATDVALTGLWLDSTDVRLHLNGPAFAAPDPAARKTGTQMRRRADVAGMLLAATDTAPAWGMDFVCGGFSPGTAAMPIGASPGPVRYGLRLLGGQVADIAAVAFDTTPVQPDSTVAAAAEDLARTLDSLGAVRVADLKRQMSASELSRTIVRGYLAAKSAYGFVYDSTPARYAAGPGPLSGRNLVNLLRGPGRLVFLSLTAGQVKTLSGTAGMTVEWGPGLSHKLTEDRNYRFAATQEFLLRHPELARSGFELSEKQFWTIAAGILQSASRR